MKLVSRLLTERFMLQVVALRTTYGQLREGKQRCWSRKRRQIKRLWDLDTWFGTRRSMVQIHSPRPLLLQSAIYEQTNGRGAPSLGPGSQWSKRIPTDHSFLSQINALRCVLNCDFYFIFADNADNIRGFCLEVRSPAQLFPLVPSETPDLFLNRWVRIRRVVPNF